MANKNRQEKKGPAKKDPKVRKKQQKDPNQIDYSKRAVQLRIGERLIVPVSTTMLKGAFDPAKRHEILLAHGLLLQGGYSQHMTIVVRASGLQRRIHMDEKSFTVFDESECRIITALFRPGSNHLKLHVDK